MKKPGPEASQRAPQRKASPVSIGMVAAQAGVSIATVSRVLNGVANKASADTKQRVQDAAIALGYRPMSVGQALRRRTSRLVALLAANLANPAMAAIAASAETALRRQGLVMVLCDTHDEPDLQDEYLLEMRAHLVRGFVLLGAVDSPKLRDFTEAGEPMLFVSRRSPLQADAPFVGIDNRAAGREVAAFLMETKRSPIAVIHGSMRSSATTERVEAFLGLLRSAGHSPPLLQMDKARSSDHLNLGYHAMSNLLRHGERPKAVFCTSDLIAFGAYRKLQEAGLRVPDDVLLFGFDDNPLNPWIAPWLHSVSVPYEAFGSAIVEGLRAVVEQPSQPLEWILPHRVVVRASNG